MNDPVTSLHIPEKNIRKVFFFSVILKGLNSVLEIIGGLLFLFTGTLTNAVESLLRIEHLLPYISSDIQYFGAFYLLSHGIVKVFLVINLLRNKLWAYPATIAVLVIFILYQIQRLAHGYSAFMVLLTLFDIFLIILTWHEYKVVEKHRKHLPHKP